MSAVREKTIIGLVVASIAAYALYTYPRFYPFPELTSLGVGSLLRFANLEAVSAGRYLVVTFKNVSQPLAISGECAGIIIMLVYMGVIFISPYFSLTHKFSAMVVIPLILLGNIIRIFIAVLLGHYVSVNTMLAFHNSVGNVFMFVWAIVCYLLWLSMINKGVRPNTGVANWLRFT